jgi:hypothetical protein
MTTTKDTQANMFDFSAVVDSLERFFDDKHPDYDPDNSKAGRFVLDNPLFAEFVAHYFAGDFIDDAWDYKDEAFLPRLYPEIDLEKPYKTFISARNTQACLRDDVITRNSKRNPKNVRGTTVYPLTFDETEGAINFIRNNDDYFLAMNAINACIVKYYKDMIDAVTDRHSSLGKPFQINISPDNNNESEKSIKKYLGQAFKTARKNLTFIHDLTTQIAGHIQDETEPFSKRSMITGFKKMFERSAFQSVSAADGYSFCPFKNSLMDMMRVGLNEGPDGVLTATPNQHNGCLIKDVRAIIRRDHYQALPTQNTYTI